MQGFQGENAVKLHDKNATNKAETCKKIEHVLTACKKEGKFTEFLRENQRKNRRKLCRINPIKSEKNVFIEEGDETPLEILAEMS